MHKEIEIHNIELQPLAESLGRIFIQRRDLYAKQLDDGRYICIRKPLKEWHLIKHLEGEITLGAYVLDQKSRARYIAFDADDNQQLVGLTHMSSQLAAKEIPSYLEASRRGGHLWLFFDRPVTGRKARIFGKRLLTSYGLDGIELFPKQPKLKGGPGSLIRLPYGIHRRSGERYSFITLDGKPLAPTLEEQLNILQAPQFVPGSAFSLQVDKGSQVTHLTDYVRTEEPQEPLSKQIKGRVSVLDFVGKYVELSPNNLGLCPFHDDHHASFSVNTEKNYWHCFAGCGGGSVIDFWMKRRDCDFVDAVGELAKMLL